MSQHYLESQHYLDESHSLRDVVQAQVARSPFVTGRNLRVELIDDEVILTGHVPTYYQKQMAQESLRGIAGVTLVRNELEVTSY